MLKFHLFNKSLFSDHMIIRIESSWKAWVWKSSAPDNLHNPYFFTKPFWVTTHWNRLENMFLMSGNSIGFGVGIKKLHRKMCTHAYLERCKTHQKLYKNSFYTLNIPWPRMRDPLCMMYALQSHRSHRVNSINVDARKEGICKTTSIWQSSHRANFIIPPRSWTYLKLDCNWKQFYPEQDLQAITSAAEPWISFAFIISLSSAGFFRIV